jgi:ATP-dependent Clp protease ATP-binding subunit ClpA
MRSNPEIEEIIAKATSLAKEFRHEYVTLEHLSVAMLEFRSFNKLVRDFGGDVKGLIQDLTDYLATQDSLVNAKSESVIPQRTYTLERVFNRAFTQVLFSSREQMEVIDLFLSITQEQNSHAAYFFLKWGLQRKPFVEFFNKDFAKKNPTKAKKKKDSADGDDEDREIANAVLAEYCTNLSEQAKEGKIDPIIGRAAEMEEITQVLARRNKSNVLMIGDPGVGKTAIAEGLAYKINEGTVPDYLKGYSVFNLEISTILAGSKFRGEFEEKLKDIIQALTVHGKSILFIDEAHQMHGAGSGNQSTVDFANIIKPALAKGTLKVIASTTYEEYTKSFEKDRALMRRFYRLNIDEPSPATAKDILRGLKIHYETFHENKDGITEEAIQAAVDLSVRYQPDRKLPDKAIDLIDMTCARLKVRGGEWSVWRSDIIDTISKATGIPKENFDSAEKTNQVDSLEANIKDKLYGQDSAVDQVLEKIYVAKAGLKDPGKPVGSFLFLGPTGTGKTELAKLLASNLSMKLIRFDMSEYQERHSVAKLIGAPPGYVGFEDSDTGGGMLIREIERHPYSVILMDEIEKAHPDVTKVLLQMMDEGTITGATGKKADCRNCIIILTSNLGAQASERNAIGFGGDLKKSGEEDAAVSEFFAPEFRNRMDGVVKFNKLSKLSMKKVVLKFLMSINHLLAEKQVKISFSEAVIDHLVDTGFDPVMGARPLARQINKLIKVPLSRKILFSDESIANTTIVTDLTPEKEVTFTVCSDECIDEMFEQPHVDANGFVIT